METPRLDNNLFANSDASQELRKLFLAVVTLTKDIAPLYFYKIRRPMQLN